MNLLFKKIHLKNFMSFEDAYVDFESNPGYTFITGINRNPSDSAKSNGAGKSTLIAESISWALTGETVRGIKDVRNMHLDGDAEVEINFAVDADEYRLVRTKGKNTNLKIYINGEDKSGKGIKDSEELLSQYLPDITSQLIGSVVILGQGMPMRFSNNTPSGRKAVLESLSKSDFMIEDIKARIERRKIELTNNVNTINTNGAVLESKINSCKDTIEEAENNLSALEPKQVMVDKIAYAKKEYTQATEMHTMATSRFEEISRELTRLREDALAKQAEIKSLEAGIRNKYAEELKQLDVDIATTNANINNLKVEIKRIDSITDTCPTCGQKLPNVSKPDSTPKKAELVVLEHSLADLYTKKQELSSKIESEIKVEKDAKSEALDKVIALGKETKKAQDDTDKECKNYKDATDKWNKEVVRLELALESRDATEAQIKEKLTNCHKDMDKYELELTENNKKLVDISHHTDVVKKFETFASRDFRGYLLTNVIAYINSKCAEYANDIFGHTDLKIELDKNNLNIEYLGKQYEALSGGERQKVDVVCQLAIRDMLCKFLNFSSSILVLDEISDNMDSIGVGKVFDLISTKLPDINNIYIISHHTDFPIPYDREIVVEKDERGVSKVVV